MLIDLSGKTALVSGSTQGIGLTIATHLAQAGAKVVINGRSEENVAQAVEQIVEKQPELLVQGITADVGSADGAQSLFEQLAEIDILVNNLGIFRAVNPFEITDEMWMRYFEINVLAAVRLTRHYLPGMMERGWGRVQFIASDSAIVIPEEMIHYGVSKTALLGVSRGFAKAAKGSGVTVNSLIVGPTYTDGVRDFVYQLVDKDIPWEDAERKFMLKYRPHSLLQRLIRPEEIAYMSLYLASPLASATTGGAIRVDGGYVDSILP